MALMKLENATVACVTVGPAIVLDAGGETYRIELELLEVWRLRRLLDLLLQQFSDRDFEQENAIKCEQYNEVWLTGLRSRSSRPATTG